MGGHNRAVIIGNGAAAVECFQAMRATGYTGEIHAFADGSLPVYNPMLTSYYAAGKIDYPLMFPYGNDFAVFERSNVTLHKDTPVTALSAKNRTVTTAQGQTMEFDSCLIASGASAFVPPFSGSDSQQVFTMRTAQDAIRLHDYMAANKPRRALVVGASMVGIKLVELFYKAKIDVCLADMAECIFPLAAHRDCAAVIEQRLQSKGVRLRFSSGIERIEPDGNGVRAWFKGSDEPEQADLVLMCIGVRANLSFLDREEITARQGVVIDDHMRTSAEGIYAAGDVAMGTNLLTGEPQIIGLWASARNQGRTAGCNMAGGDAQYKGDILHNITHFMNMDFVGIGDVLNYDQTEKWADSEHYVQFFYRDGKLCGANLLDLFDDAGVVKNALVKALLHKGQVELVRRGDPSKIQDFLLKNLFKQVQTGAYMY